MITVASIVVTFAIVPTQFQKVLHILELQVLPAPSVTSPTTQILSPLTHAGASTQCPSSSTLFFVDLVICTILETSLPAQRA
jgi:hypothetical protein